MSFDVTKNGSESDKQPSSAPKVPRELLSARPPMTNIRPKAPDQIKLSNLSADENAQIPAEDLGAHQAKIDYLKNLRNEAETNLGSNRNKSSGKKWLIGLAVIILILGLVGAGYFVVFRHSTAKSPSTSKNNASTTTPAQTSNEQPAEDTKSYDSDNFMLSLKYPQSWMLDDTADKLTILSNSMEIESATGAKTTSAVLVTIRHKQAELAEFKQGNAVAVLESQKINYSEPAPGQRDSTYISFLQYASSNIKGALDAIYITGNSGYQKGQYIPAGDITKVDPLINVSFVNCKDKCSVDSPAFTISSKGYSESNFKNSIQNILKSLAIH